MKKSLLISIHFLLLVFHIQTRTINASSAFDNHTSVSYSNKSEKSTCTTEASICKPGVLLPVWTPAHGVSLGDTIARSIVYGLALAYLFLGVSIISDRFMSAIEVITSQEKEIHVTDSNGNKQTVMVRYWNETVSNLTVRFVLLLILSYLFFIL